MRGTISEIELTPASLSRYLSSTPHERRTMDSAATLPEANPLRSSNVAPEAVDLSHHLSQLSRERMTSPLKSLYKCVLLCGPAANRADAELPRYMSQPGMTMLAGGLPSPEYCA